MNNILYNLMTLLIPLDVFNSSKVTHKPCGCMKVAGLAGPCVAAPYSLD